MSDFSARRWLLTTLWQRTLMKVTETCSMLYHIPASSGRCWQVTWHRENKEWLSIWHNLTWINTDHAFTTLCSYPQRRKTPKLYIKAWRMIIARGLIWITTIWYRIYRTATRRSQILLLVWIKHYLRSSSQTDVMLILRLGQSDRGEAW